MKFNELNEGDQALLNAIFVKEPFELTEEEVAILKARYDYLPEEYVQKFASLFKPKEKPVAKMNREELNAKLVELGANPEDYKESTNKQIVAIIEAELAK